MKILVTGGCGFIGRNLVAALAAAGHTVRVLDNLSVGAAEALAGRGAELVVGDVCDAGLAAQALTGMQAVVHLAAQTGVIPSQQAPEYDFEVNARGTLGLLEAARAAGVRGFVFASSNAAVGNAAQPVEESQPARPLSPYGASKLAGEAYCSAYHASYGLATVALRFANVYGPGSSHKESVVARFIKDLAERGELTIYGDGQQTRDLVHVRDLCAAIERALTEPAAAGQVFQIGTGIETPVAVLAEMVRHAMGQPAAPLRFLPERPGEIRRNYSRIDRAQAVLGWRPTVELAAGVVETCAWFKQQNRAYV